MTYLFWTLSAKGSTQVGVWYVLRTQILGFQTRWGLVPSPSWPENVGSFLLIDAPPGHDKWIQMVQGVGCGVGTQDVVIQVGYNPYKNYPSGWKPRQRFERFWKNVVFAIAKLLTFISKIVEFCRAKSSCFNIMACKLKQFLCWKLARFFSLSAAHAFVQHATSFLQIIFWKKMEKKWQFFE